MTSLLLVLSGFAALAYQVLWMRDLTVLFGASAHAAAVVLATFFGGLAAGAALFARLSPRVAHPLRVYGLLEIGIAASAVLALFVLDAYGGLYTAVYRHLSQQPFARAAVTSMLAVTVLGLPTALMGATLPAMVQHRGHSAWLYGMNTAGAAAGAFASGFYLLPVLGFRWSYVLAVALNVVAGAIALGMPQREGRPAEAPPRRVRRQSASGEMVALSPRRTSTLAFASGALTIGLEVTWLRMFGQVLDNSVYAFSAVVVVALVAFAGASLLVARARSPKADAGSLALALAVAGVAAAVLPATFVGLTNGLAPVGADDWLSYIRSVFARAGVIVGISGLAAGLVFPLLLRRVPDGGAPGAAVGRLLAWNTVGAISGSLVTTFLVLRYLGAWGTCAAIAVAYGALAVWLAQRIAARRRFVTVLALLATVGAAAFSTTLPRVRLDAGRSERVLELWEGSHGTVAVTETTDGRVLRLNNSYSLGGTTDRIERERIQTLIPMLLHPHPARVFFLGLGTGITAGEALRHPVERVVVCELVPEVVRASRDHFSAWTRGLASDRRVEMRAEDGRHYLAATSEAFDVIISDLFVPWHAGTGMLYTREHFEAIRARLRPGGLFAQWLPLFQLDQRNFEVIARTLQSVFPHVVIWRGDFYANRPIVALVASGEPMRIDAAELIARARRLAPAIGDSTALAGVLPFYAGNVGAARELVADSLLNTDEHPIIEFRSPQAQFGSGAEGWFVSTRLVRFLDRISAAVPSERDPYLAGVSPEHRRYVDAGRFYYRAVVERLNGDDELAAASLAEALVRLPEDVQIQGPFMALEPLVQ